MSLNDIDNSFFFELEYKIVNEEKTKIFGQSFVDKNKDKCKIIYSGKEYELTDYFKFDKNLNNKACRKIQLIINNNITDISCMFIQCKTLLSIRDISNLDNSNIINKNKSFSESNSDNPSEESSNSNGFYKNETFNDNNSELSAIPLK